MCMPDVVQLQMRKDAKKGKLMHSLSMPLCPCLSETVCAHLFCMSMFGSIALTCHVLACDQRQQVAHPRVI